MSEQTQIEKMREGVEGVISHELPDANRGHAGWAVVTTTFVHFLKSAHTKLAKLGILLLKHSSCF